MKKIVLSFVAVATLSMSLSAKNNDELMGLANKALQNTLTYQSPSAIANGPIWEKWRKISKEAEIIIPLKETGIFSKNWEVDKDLPIYLQVNREVNRDEETGKILTGRFGNQSSRWGNPCYITLQDKAEDYEKICEMGVSRITPLFKLENEKRVHLKIDSFFNGTTYYNSDAKAIESKIVAWGLENIIKNDDETYEYINDEYAVWRSRFHFDLVGGDKWFTIKESKITHFSYKNVFNTFEEANLSADVLLLKEKTKEITKNFTKKHIEFKEAKIKEKFLENLEEKEDEKIINDSKELKNNYGENLDSVSSDKQNLEVNLGACKQCHGQKFDKAALDKSKIVKDMTKSEVYNALIGYKNGTYGSHFAGVMKGQVAKYSADDLRRVAALIGR